MQLRVFRCPLMSLSTIQMFYTSWNDYYIYPRGQTKRPRQTYIMYMKASWEKPFEAALTIIDG